MKSAVTRISRYRDRFNSGAGVLPRDGCREFWRESGELGIRDAYRATILKRYACPRKAILPAPLQNRLLQRKFLQDLSLRPVRFPTL